MKKYIISAILISTFLGVNFNNSFAEEVVNKEVSKEVKEVKQLKLNGVEVVGKKELKLEFGSKIDSNSDKDISVISVGNNGEKNLVKNYEVNDENVLLTLENELESNSEYEVIIFAIVGENGSTITSGLDGALKFTTPDLSVFDEVAEVVEPKLESAGAEVKKEVKEEVKKEVKKEVKEDNPNLAGKDISKEELKDKIEVVAGKKEKLVQTGPEHVLLIIFALILSGLIGYTFNQRKNNQI